MQLQMYWEVQYMNMHDYLMTVSEQIRCRRAWPMIEKELRDHIEDQKIDCMAEGMTEKEAETLRIAELEWMKERDQAAARAAEASPVPQNQTLESRRAMAEETRVRCYELMEEYEEILERMPDGAASE